MTESSVDRPGCGPWLAVFLLAGWLAVVPLAAGAVVLQLSGHPPDILIQLGLSPGAEPRLPAWAAGLLSTLLTLGLHLAALLPAWLLTRRPAHRFVHAVAGLAIVIAVYLALRAVARLPWPADPTRTAALQLLLTLPFVLACLGWASGWRVLDLRGSTRGAALWLALAAAAVALWPWVLVGSLGSAGTTAANVLQALPNALGEEILFRGLALLWLWRALVGPSADSAQPRRDGWLAAAAGLLLFVAAQGATVLPAGDWGVLGRFVVALALGLLFTELTIRAGGSIWPAVVVHFLYDWFHLAFVDPRTEADLMQALALIWTVFSLGGRGLMLWVQRRLRQPAPAPSAAVEAGDQAGRGSARLGLLLAALVAVVFWAALGALYFAVGEPGFHPDGFLIYLDEQADLSPAAAIDDPAARRAWVFRTLTETADRSQAELRAELDRRGVAYRPHYIVNAIEVLARPGLRRTFAGRPGVASVLFMPGVRPYPHRFSPITADSEGPNGVEWNVREIGADQVWAEGITGQGIVVGNGDSGVTWDHPALKAAYLGWDPDRGQVDHDYAWYDPFDGRPEPWDDSGHGTHTTGTVLGQDGRNEIGVAPGARWIACRNMRHGIGNPGSYISCMEFLLAPFPLGGDPFRDGDPARGAHVVNNSWGCPAEEGCRPDTLQIAVDHLRAAGQMMVVSAGNEGPACGTVTHPPAIYDSVYSVGAVSPADQVVSFSSRGPVAVDGSARRKPDIVAPGSSIRSSTPNGYGLSSGTSMAGPHVAGAVALLWSAQPRLIGDVDRTEQILSDTAQRLTVDATCSGALPGAGPGAACGCGADQPGEVPTNVYGWGEVDVWAAVQAALQER